MSLWRRLSGKALHTASYQLSLRTGKKFDRASKQVETTQNNIAIVYKKINITYNKLNRRANRLANYLLHTHSIKADTLIALCLDRSEHMLIAILAIVKVQTHDGL